MGDPAFGALRGEFAHPLLQFGKASPDDADHIDCNSGVSFQEPLPLALAPAYLHRVSYRDGFSGISAVSVYRSAPKSPSLPNCEIRTPPASNA